MVPNMSTKSITITLRSFVSHRFYLQYTNSHLHYPLSKLSYAALKRRVAFHIITGYHIRLNVNVLKIKCCKLLESSFNPFTYLAHTGTRVYSIQLYRC